MPYAVNDLGLDATVIIAFVVFLVHAAIIFSSPVTRLTRLPGLASEMASGPPP